jgi:hypothetical protein
VQRSGPLPLRESHNITIGTIYAALYVMYARRSLFRCSSYGVNSGRCRGQPTVKPTR